MAGTRKRSTRKRVARPGEKPRRESIPDPQATSLEGGLEGTTQLPPAGVGRGFRSELAPLVGVSPQAESVAAQHAAVNEEIEREVESREDLRAQALARVDRCGNCRAFDTSAFQERSVSQGYCRFLPRAEPKRATDWCRQFLKR